MKWRVVLRYRAERWRQAVEPPPSTGYNHVSRSEPTNVTLLETIRAEPDLNDSGLMTAAEAGVRRRRSA